MLMVLALLAMGLGCSEEPPEPWSHSMRQGIVDGCVIGMDSDRAIVERMVEEGYTVLGLCRDVLGKLEALYTESDFLLLSEDEANEVVGKIGYDYGQEIAREIDSD